MENAGKLKGRFFQKAVIGVALAFATVMLIVIAIAYSRPSRVTKIDVSQMQTIREQKKSI